MIKVKQTLTIKYILERVSQEDIMEKYLGIAVTNQTQKANSFRSIFRKDINPTCNYYYSEEGKLRVMDFGTGNRYDCFDVAAYVNEINIKVSQGFMLLLNKIAYDFKIHKYENENERVAFKTIFTEQKTKKQIKTFKVVPRSWNAYDKKYWYDKYGIGSELLRYAKVLPIQELWIEGKDGYLTRVYTYNVNNSGYAYFGGNFGGITLWKCYFPLTKNRNRKFYTNYSFVQGLHLVRPAQIGIITKSYKDVLVYKTLGIEAVAVASETQLMSAKMFYKLKSYFDILITNFDYDKAGILLSNKYKKTYGCLPLMLTTGRFNQPNFGQKDISDYRDTYGESLTKRLIYSVYSQYEEELNIFSNNLKQSIQWIK